MIKKQQNEGQSLLADGQRERALNCHVPLDEGLRLSSLALKQHDAHKNSNMYGVLQREFEATKMQEIKCLKR